MPVLPASALDFAARLLAERTGLAFGPARRQVLEEEMGKALTRWGDVGTYLARLASEPSVFDELVAGVTVSETYFFREPEQLATIREEILPELAERIRDRRIRVWSAGCASGEEPYTLALVVAEAGLADRVHIVGTDLSRAALVRAERARYTRWSLRATPDEIAAKYFHARGREFELDVRIRALVAFGYLNLATDLYPSLSTGLWGMDLILCRNVFIYFDGATIARVARRLVATLAPGGWLLLGASDPPLGDEIGCEAVLTGGGLVYRARPLPGESGPVLPRPRDVAWRAEPAKVPDQVWAAGDGSGNDSTSEVAAGAAPPPKRTGERWALLVREAANRGDLAAAGTACARGLEQDPHDAELMLLHGWLLAERGLLAEAARALRGALYLDRGLAVGHLALGQVLARLGDREGARRSLRNALRLLRGAPAEQPVPGADGETAGRLAEMIRVYLDLLTPEHAA
jgi:chemotaxis protein methyltransferase CheR